MFRRVPCVLVAVVLAVCDAAITTLLLIHGDAAYHHFTQGVYSYHFNKSTFDLWVIGCVRFCILIGGVLAVAINPRDSIPRVKYLRKGVFCFTVLACMFSMIKLLSLSETESNLHDVWLWSVLVWSVVGSIILYLGWHLLGKIEVGHSLVVNVDDNEHEPLLGDQCRYTKSTDKCDRSEDKENKVEIKRASLLRLWSYSKPDWPLVLTGFMFLTISAVAEIFIPFYTGQAVDGIVIDKSESVFTRAIVIMAILSVISALAGGVRGGCLMLAIFRLQIRIRNILFTSIVSQEIGFFDTAKTGDITSRLTSDTTTMSEALGLNANIFLRNFIKACGVVFFMVKLSWRISLVTFIGLPLVFGISKLYGEYYQKLSKLVQDSLAKVNEVAEEVCSSMRTVRSFANEDGETKRYASALQDTYKLEKKQCLAYTGFMWCSRIFELSLTVAVLYYGGHLVVTSKITGGTLVSFILYQIQLGVCLEEIGSVYTGLMQAVGASEKIMEYIDRKPRVVNDGKLAPSKLSGRIEFRNVTFAYPVRPDTNVLKNVSFSIARGEVVALVGPSGGGKTSCFNLLEHFYNTVSGQVLLGGVPIQDFQHHYLHRKLALVGQEPVLYARSVEDNINYGLPEEECSMERVQDAARRANAHNFITELDHQYKTETGEKGVQMSGGQKQRIAIARALIRNPVVLLLDEATSALDSESEHMVQQAIYENLPGRTVIIIAHRLSTVERADRIIVINKGCVVEQGTHRQLLRKEGMYASLVKRQLLSSESDRTLEGGDSSSGRKRRLSSGTRYRTPSGNRQSHDSGSDDRKSPVVEFFIGSA